MWKMEDGRRIGGEREEEKDPLSPNCRRRDGGGRSMTLYIPTASVDRCIYICMLPSGQKQVSAIKRYYWPGMRRTDGT